MLRPHSPLLRAAHRKLAVWLLAVLVLAQSVGASVLTTLGPAHVHEAVRVTAGLEAFDLRRAPARATSNTVHALIAVGHFHADGQAHRHHHRRDDTSVVLVDGSASQPADEASDAAFAAALAALALLPPPLDWTPAGGRAAFATSASWPLLTHDSRPLEKPPRLA